MHCFLCAKDVTKRLLEVIYPLPQHKYRHIYRVCVVFFWWYSIRRISHDRLSEDKLLHHMHMIWKQTYRRGLEYACDRHILPSKKQTCRHFDKFFVTGCTGSCQFDSAASVEDFIKISTFLIPWIQCTYSKKYGYLCKILRKMNLHM